MGYSTESVNREPQLEDRLDFRDSRSSPGFDHSKDLTKSSEGIVYMVWRM